LLISGGMSRNSVIGQVQKDWTSNTAI